MKEAIRQEADRFTTGVLHCLATIGALVLVAAIIAAAEAQRAYNLRRRERLDVRIPHRGE